MEKIVLTDEQKQVIQEQLDGKIEVHSATDEQQRLLMQVIKMAEARLDEYPEDYDFGSDLIAWFWNEYQTQEKESA